MTYSIRALFHFALADFRERRRQYGFYIMLVLSLYLGYVIYTSDIIITLGAYRGIYNSAWVGSLMALTLNALLGLGGFYLIKNSIQRDKQTGVWQIIAATPAKRISYLFGKWLSHFAVLSLIILVLVFTSIIMLTIQRDTPSIEIWPLLAPFIFTSLPMMAFLSGLTILFEVLPWLKGGFGNIVYFFLYMFGLSNSIDTFSKYNALNDPLGFQLISQSMVNATKQAFPAYNGSFSFLSEPKTLLGTFVYEGVDWTLELILARFIWFIVGFALVGLAALLFNRFTQPAKQKRAKPKKLTEEVKASTAIYKPLSTLPNRKTGFAFVRVLIGEIKLLFKPYPLWVYFLLLGLNIAVIFTPFDIAQGYLFPITWALPLLLWSKLGCRENEHNAGQLIFSAPHLLSNQWTAAYFAGVLLTALSGSGMLIRYLSLQNPALLLTWLVGAFFIPALALFLGALTGTSRAFEIVYALIWYMGPMQGLPILDYMGTLHPANPTQFTLFYLALAIILLFFAYLIRYLRLRFN